MPPKDKALACSGKKGKALRKQNPPLLTSESGGEENEPSVRDMLHNMMEMTTSLDTRMGMVQGDNRKKRKDSYRGETSTTCSASQRLQPLLGSTDLPTLPRLPSTSPADVDRPAAPLNPAL